MPADEDGEGWLRLLECVICLEPTRRPVRPWHQPPRFNDCGVVLCAECFDKWRRMPQPVCPKCRADVVFLGVSADGPLVGGAGLPDPLLVRLLAEAPFLGQEEATTPADTTKVDPMEVAFDVPNPPAPPPPPQYPGVDEPVSLTAIRAMLRLLEPTDARHPWTDDIVTTTTLIVDDHEARSLRILSPVVRLSDLEAHLGWSRRIGLTPEHTVRCIAHHAARIGPSPSSEGVAAMGEWDPAWIRSVTVDVRGVRFVRTLAAALAAVQRWTRAFPDDPRAKQWRHRFLTAATA